jgi:hypothetical protein
MNREEFKANPAAQKKFGIFAGVFVAGVLCLMFGGSVRSTVRAMGSRKPSSIVRAAVPRAAAPPPVVAPAVPVAPVAPALPPDVVELNKLLGIWGGSVPVEGVGGGLCEIRLELKPGEEKPGFIGYSTISCAHVPIFRPGQTSNPNRLGDWMQKAKPVSAILTGEIRNGSIELVQEKAIGSNESGCNIVSAVLTPFSELMAVSWKSGPANWKEQPESACGGGDVVMHRVKTY